MGFISWILFILVIIGILYYINEIYGPKKKENFNNNSEDTAQDKKTKNNTNNVLEDEEEEEPPPKPKKKAKKQKKICFGDKCIPKATLQMELDAVDDETREELRRMLDNN